METENVWTRVKEPENKVSWHGQFWTRPKENDLTLFKIFEEEKEENEILTNYLKRLPAR